MTRTPDFLGTAIRKRGIEYQYLPHSLAYGSMQSMCVRNDRPDCSGLLHAGVQDSPAWGAGLGSGGSLVIISSGGVRCE